MIEHLSSDLGVAFEGQPTNNMYGLEMAEQSLLPLLKQIPNLNLHQFEPLRAGMEGRSRTWTP